MISAPIHTLKDLLLPNEQDTRVILPQVTKGQCKVDSVDTPFACSFTNLLSFYHLQFNSVALDL